MNGTMITTTVVLGSGIFLLGWYDLFHLVVGVPLLVAKAFLVRWWKKHREMEGEELPFEDDEAPAPKAFVGALSGVASLVLLAGGFWGASALGLADWFYSRDCPALLARINDLEKGEAYSRIAAIVDERLLTPASPACKEDLTEKKARAVLSRAPRMTGENKLEMLNEASRVAAQTKNLDLRHRIQTEIEKERATISLAQQQKQLKEQEEELSRIQARLRDLQVSGLDAQETAKTIELTLPDFLFDSGQARLTVHAQEKLQEVASTLRRRFPDRRLQIIGHTDSTGSREANQLLSERRAQNVQRALINNGVSQALISALGRGRDSPIASNEATEGRARNRRVEIIIEK